MSPADALRLAEHKRKFARKVRMNHARRKAETKEALAARNAYRAAIGLPPVK